MSPCLVYFGRKDISRLEDVYKTHRDSYDLLKHVYVLSQDFSDSNVQYLEPSDINCLFNTHPIVKTRTLFIQMFT
jgi:hypothetical protein